MIPRAATLNNIPAIPASAEIGLTKTAPNVPHMSLYQQVKCPMPIFPSPRVMLLLKV